MNISRKNFLQTTTLASASLFMPKLLNAFTQNNFTAVPKGNKVFVVLQFSGGNDGLNTIIPVNNDIYYKERPELSIKKNDAIKLTDDAYINSSLKALADIYSQDGMAIINNVGYENADRSHFRSMDIWHSASQSNEYLHSGWLGRYLDEACKNCTAPTQALEIDDILSLALKGNNQKGIALKDPKKLFNTSQAKYFKSLAQKNHHDEHEKPVDYLYKTLTNAVNSADYILKQSKLNPTTLNYPSTELGKSFKNIASLIFSDINTKVYYVSLGSFDTHVNQKQQQEKLFTELNDAIEIFVKDLKQNNRFDDVLLMTFSEFGRRVSQNASKGTDHGTANNIFLIGGGLKQKGILNEMPNLENLKDGDLQHTVDFKSVYATILNKWLGADDVKILNKKYTLLDFC